jgi:hypothetical protein
VIALALVFALTAQQEAPVRDVPVYQNAAIGIALPRPFNDWVFAPATERGTTTVIFQPRDGSLSDQLWGALVLAPFGPGAPLEEIADRRIASSWRSTLGPNYALLARDSVELAGLPAVHIVMSGSINLAVLDVEEYLLMRDSTLIVLQFRYPRGQPRDSIAAGYARSLRGLRIRPPAAPLSPLSPVSPLSPWSVTVARGQILFDLPASLRAIAPGALTSEIVAAGRRMMRWSPTVGRADTALYAVGHFRAETRRVDRLTLRIWRSESADNSINRVNDTLIGVAAEAWGRYWRVLGAVPTAELALVETMWSETRGGPAILFIGRDADTATIRRELSRTWWGGVVRSDRSTGSLVEGALPDWSLTLLDSLRQAPAALAAARTIVGEPRWREALRTFVAESRDGGPALQAFLRVLGDSASELIRPLLR